MISAEKNAHEPLCSSQAKKLPALMWHVIRQAVTPGAWTSFCRRCGFTQEGAQGTPVTFASQSCLRLSPRLAFDCKGSSEVRGRRGAAVDFGGCSELQGWEWGAAESTLESLGSSVAGCAVAKGTFTWYTEQHCPSLHRGSRR